MLHLKTAARSAIQTRMAAVPARNFALPASQECRDHLERLGIKNKNIIFNAP